MFGIFKLARAIVQSVTGMITAQINLIQNAITSPLKGFVQQVTGGIWKGDGSVKFVNEMTSQVIPQLVSIGNINMSFSEAIKKAVETMNQADKQAASKANELFDVFGKIFKF